MVSDKVIVDYHIHTDESDGILTPEEVIKRAKKRGCSEIAITDHDVAGSYEKLGKKYDISVIPGIEFNTSIRNMHILGYGMNDTHRMNQTMKKIRLQNEKICLQVIQLLEQDGFDISIVKLRQYLESIELSTEIIDKRKLVKYLIYKGYVDTVLEAYNKLIGVGTKYYIQNVKLTPSEVINLIDSCGGIAVLAHPNTLGLPDNQLQEFIKQLQYKGLIGIEIINSRNSLPLTETYSMIADNLSLIKTVGSDFHTPVSESLGYEVNEVIPRTLRKTIENKRN